MITDTGYRVLESEILRLKELYQNGIELTGGQAKMIKKVKRSIFKNLFINLEKEENWLNNMCKNGFASRDII